MMTPDLKNLLQMKSFAKDGASFVSRENVDNFLLAYFSFLTQKQYPALEIGVYEGDSAGYLCEALIMQGRSASLIDNLHFLKTPEEQTYFITHVIEKNLNAVGVSPEHFELIVESSLIHDWGKKKFSYIHIDAHNPLDDINTALKISSETSIISIDDFLIVPYHLEVVIKAIQNGQLFPFAIGTKKIWCTNKLEFAQQIMADKTCWEPLHDILRMETFNFFGYPIYKIYNSKKYHQKMYNYYQS